MMYGHALDPGVQPALTMPSNLKFKCIAKQIIQTSKQIQIFTILYLSRWWRRQRCLAYKNALYFYEMPKFHVQLSLDYLHLD